MKLITFVLLLPIVVHAQQLNHAVFVGSNYSFFSSNSDMFLTTPYRRLHPMKYWHSGISGRYVLEYAFPLRVMLGTALQYNRIGGIFNTPCFNCGSITTIIISKRSVVKTNDLDIPIYLKFITNKINYTYFQTGMGINWLFSAHRKVENDVQSIMKPEEEPFRTEIINEPFSLKNGNNNSIGTFFHVAIGQVFHIHNQKFIVELSYRNDINTWTYQTIGTKDGIKQHLPIRRQGLLLSIGYNFYKNDKTE